MVEQVLAILGKLGLQARAAARFPDWQTLDHLVQLVQMPDAAAAHDAYLRTRPNDYGPQVRARARGWPFHSGRRPPDGAARARHLSAAHARQTFKGLDIAILPILADPLPTIAELDVGGGPKVQAAMGRVVKYTRPINYLGLPTLTLPVPRQWRTAERHPAHRPAVRRGAAVRHRPGLPARGAARDRPAAALSVSRRQRLRRRWSFTRVAVVAGDQVAQAVAAVDVRPEHDAAVELGPGRDVGEVDRHRPRQHEVDRLARRR